MNQQQVDDFVEVIASEIVNADLPSVGPFWPWPGPDGEKWDEIRDHWRDAARVAIRKTLQILTVYDPLAETTDGGLRQSLRDMLEKFNNTQKAPEWRNGRVRVQGTNVQIAGEDGIWRKPNGCTCKAADESICPCATCFLLLAAV